MDKADATYTHVKIGWIAPTDGLYRTSGYLTHANDVEGQWDVPTLEGGVMLAEDGRLHRYGTFRNTTGAANGTGMNVDASRLWLRKGEMVWFATGPQEKSKNANYKADMTARLTVARDDLETLPRNTPDFRELGNDSDGEHDKSVHQTQAIELRDGTVLIAYGQNSSARRLARLDPDWLLETSRTEDFRQGLGGLSNHLYLKSLSGGWCGWAGHCAWNRLPGAVLMRDPDTDAGTGSAREVLRLCRIPDPRLVSNRQGVVWNFPAARTGELAIDCRIDGASFRSFRATARYCPSGGKTRRF